jgi:hypothetical protein
LNLLHGANEAREHGEIVMMHRLNALISAKFRGAQKAAASNDQKRASMTLLQPELFRKIAGGDGTASPKGSW